MEKALENEKRAVGSDLSEISDIHRELRKHGTWCAACEVWRLRKELAAIHRLLNNRTPG